MDAGIKRLTGALNIERDMVQELTEAFQDPLTALKVTVPSSPYKVSVDLYSAPLFKTPKVEAEMTKQMCNICTLAIYPDTSA